MSGEERLKQIDPGTGLTLEELIDAFITDTREAKRLKAYLSRNKAEEASDEKAKTAILQARLDR